MATDDALVQEDFIVAEMQADRADLKVWIAGHVGGRGGTCQLCGLVVGDHDLHVRHHLRSRDAANSAPTEEAGR